MTEHQRGVISSSNSSISRQLQNEVVDKFGENGEEDDTDNTVAWISMAVAALALLVSLWTYIAGLRHRRLMLSVELKKYYTTSYGGVHPWRRAAWLLFSKDYPELPFKIGEVNLTLGLDVYNYIHGVDNGPNLSDEQKSSIRAVMDDTCEELASLLDLVKTRKVNEKYLRGFVFPMVFRIWNSRRVWADDYKNELKELSEEFQLGINFTDVNKRVPVSSNVDPPKLEKDWSIWVRLLSLPVRELDWPPQPVAAQAAGQSQQVAPQAAGQPQSRTTHPQQVASQTTWSV